MVLKLQDKIKILQNKFHLKKLTDNSQIQCEKCGAIIIIRIQEGKRVQIAGLNLPNGIFHHKDGNRNNDDEKNILVVCYPCHGWGRGLKKL